MRQGQELCITLSCLSNREGQRGHWMRKESTGKSTSVLTINTGQIWAKPQTTVAFSRAIEPNKMRRGSWGEATKHVTLSPERHNKKCWRIAVDSQKATPESSGWYLSNNPGREGNGLPSHFRKDSIILHVQWFWHPAGWWKRVLKPKSGSSFIWPKEYTHTWALFKICGFPVKSYPSSYPTESLRKPRSEIILLMCHFFLLWL